MLGSGVCTCIQIDSCLNIKDTEKILNSNSEEISWRTAVQLVYMLKLVLSFLAEYAGPLFNQ